MSSKPDNSFWRMALGSACSRICTLIHLHNSNIVGNIPLNVSHILMYIIALCVTSLCLYHNFTAPEPIRGKPCVFSANHRPAIKQTFLNQIKLISNAIGMWQKTNKHLLSTFYISLWILDFNIYYIILDLTELSWRVSSLRTSKSLDLCPSWCPSLITSWKIFLLQPSPFLFS